MRFHMNNAKKTRPIPAIVPERMALETTQLSVTTLKPPPFAAARRPSVDWKLPSVRISIATPPLHLLIKSGRGRDSW